MFIGHWNADPYLLLNILMLFVLMASFHTFLTLFLISFPKTLSVPISLHRQVMWNLNMEDSRIFPLDATLNFDKNNTRIFFLYLHAITSTFHRNSLIAEDNLITSLFLFQVSRVDSYSHFKWVIFLDNPEKLIKVKHEVLEIAKVQTSGSNLSLK